MPFRLAPHLADIAPAAQARALVLDRDWRHAPIPSATPAQVHSARQILEGRFTYVGETHVLGPDHDWAHNPSRDKEWLIAHHKHYFAFDLMQACAATGEACFVDAWSRLVRSWLDRMGTGHIAASDAQVEAKRVESWIKSLVVLARAPGVHARVDPLLLLDLVRRISSEAHYIARNLRPSRNHRTFQLYAIVLAGLLLADVEGHDALAELGMRELTANLLADFLPRGVHVERSTHYHNITLETALDFLDLARRNDRAVDPALSQRLRLALAFAAATQLPDGGMLSINDSDVQDHAAMFLAGATLLDEPAYEWIATRGVRGIPPAWGSREFDGYLLLRDGWGSNAAGYAGQQHVFLDCAPLGEGSHSHYDLLNVGWFAGGAPVLVDPGRYTYDAEPGMDGIDWRREFKSTRFHNTVEIDRRDQTRYLSKARLPPLGVERYDKRLHRAKHGPDAEVFDFRHAIGRNTDWAMATAVSHEYAPRHARALVFVQRQYVVVLDVVTCVDGNEHEATLRYHLAATWLDRLQLRSRFGGHVLAPDTSAAPWWIGVAASAPAEVGLASGWVSASYGVKQPAPVLEVGVRSRTTFGFASVLMPASCLGASLSCKGFSLLPADTGAIGVSVDLEIDGRWHRDAVIFAPAGMSVDRQGVSYEGSLLTVRTAGDGRIFAIDAAAPGRISTGDGEMHELGAHWEWP